MVENFCWLHAPIWRHERQSNFFFFKIFFITIFIRSLLFPGNTKGGSITVPLTSCLTGLDWSVLQIKTKIVSTHTADFKPVKQEVNGTVILPPLVFPAIPLFRMQPLTPSPWQTETYNVVSCKGCTIPSSWECFESKFGVDVV